MLYSKIFIRCIIPVTGNALLSAGTSLLGGFFTNKSNEDSVERQNAFNAAENQKNRDFNAEQAQIARDFNAQESQKTRDFNSDEARKQRDWEKEMYDYQNAYNSPSAMLQRYKEAGLNPMLVGLDGQGTASVGSGASASASPASSSPASAPSSIPQQAFQMSDMFNQSLNSYWQAQLAKTEAQGRDLDNRFKLDSYQVRLDELSTALSLSKYDLEKMKPAQVAQLEQATKNMNKQFDVLCEQIKDMKALAKLHDNQGNLVQKEVDSFAQKLQQELNESDSRIRLNDNNAKLAVAKMAEAYQSIENMKKQGQLIDAQVTSQVLANGLVGLEFEYQNSFKGEIRKFKLNTLRAEQNEAVSRANIIGLQEVHDTRLSERYDIPIYGSALIGVEGFFGSLGSLFKGVLK